MAPFPLLEELQRALSGEGGSGHQPSEVAEALARFFRDARQSFYAGAQSRWQTPLFLEHRDPLALGLARAETLSRELSGSALATDESATAALEELKAVSRDLQSRFAALEEEERGHQIPLTPSPRLNQVLYLWEGRRQNLLPEGPVRHGLEQFRTQFDQVNQEMKRALELSGKNETEQEQQALVEIREHTEQLGALLACFLELLRSSEPSGLPSGAQLADLASRLYSAYQVLEACHPVRQNCPFCQGQIALTGRCQSCGRLLPHLEESPDVDGPEPQEQSAFRAIHFRNLESAVTAWAQAPDVEAKWRALQDEVRVFGEHVTQGKRQLEMLSAHPERPVSPDSAERQTEELLHAASALISQSYQELSRFALQAFPPAEALRPNWREPLLEAEQHLLEVEHRSSGPAQQAGAGAAP